MGWPQNAYVGQKVVCVIEPGNGRTRMSLPNEVYSRLPRLNEVLTIRNIAPYGGRAWPTAKVCFQFAEIDGHGAFADPRFRPVQSTESGMEVLRGALKTTKIREDA